MGKESVTQRRERGKKRYKQQETHAWWHTYPVSFGERKPQRPGQQGGNIPSAHTTCHLIL